MVPIELFVVTAFLKRSPELTAVSCGKRCIKRSACVPLPTPGAPTRMTLAALFNFLDADSTMFPQKDIAMGKGKISIAYGNKSKEHIVHKKGPVFERRGN